ncbi:hypothetical protein [Enterobacter roggenkampii]|nr:hypothetical protein [Enterobacter roggenkampii]
MKYQWFLIASALSLPQISNATEIPKLGDVKAQSHQICGNTIDVEVVTLDNRSTLLGLKNNQTHNIDLFVSSEQSPDQMNYSKFTPARYDELSKTYIATEDPDIEIVWGSSEDEKKQISYSLALGPEVYSCTKLQKWPSEKANNMYGEKSSI